jgi:hypothetical protein
MKVCLLEGHRRSQFLQRMRNGPCTGHANGEEAASHRTLQANAQDVPCVALSRLNRLHWDRGYYLSGGVPHFELHRTGNLSRIRDNFLFEKSRFASLVSHVSPRNGIESYIGADARHIPPGATAARALRRCESVRQLRHVDAARPAQ